MVSTELLIFDLVNLNTEDAQRRRKTSWTVFDYFATLSQLKIHIRSGTRWQPKKEPRSPEARAKVAVKEQRRARQRSPEEALKEALRKQPRRQPRSRRRRVEPVKARRKRQSLRRKRERKPPVKVGPKGPGRGPESLQPSLHRQQ